MNSLSDEKVYKVKHELAEINMQRIKQLSFILIFIMCVLLIYDYYNYTRGYWAANPGYLHLTYARFIFIFGLGLLLALIKFNSYQNIYILKHIIIHLSVIVLLGCSFYITYAYILINGLITVFALGAFGLAIVIYLNPVSSFIYYFIYYGALILLSFSIDLPPRRPSSYLINSTIIITISFYVSRSVYKMKIKDIIRGIVIEEQNAKLESKNNELKSLSSMKDNFVAMVNHDLKNVMGSILSSTKYILKSDLSDEFKEYVYLLNKTTKTLLKLADDFLQVALFESGKIKLDFQVVNLRSLVDDVINTFSFIFENRNIKTICEINRDIDLEIDPEKIYTVFSNLISNSLKFTQSGGKIKIFEQRKEECIEIHVIDEGIGIPNEKLEKIFLPYEKVQLEGIDGEKGTGLGLAICRQIIELHNGKINVKSELGKGSDFFFSIPFKSGKKNEKLILI